MKNLLRTAALTAATLLLWTTVGWGQRSISSLNTVISENFNTLTNGAWTNGSTADGWYAKTDATASITTYGANTGSTTAAGLYAFGVAGVNPLSDRALGFAPSNAYTGAAGIGKGYIGWRLVNNTGQAITSIEVKWTGEQWRKENNSAAHSLVLTYQIGATVSDLTSGTWTTSTSIFTSPIFAATTAAALDGNNSANRVADITFLIEATILAGEEIMLRWEDLNDSGNDHLMAIDDVSIQAFAAAGDTNPPVATFAPLNGATDVAVTVNPTITFNEAIRNIDNSEITNANVASLLTLKDAALADVPFTASINVAKTVITVTPTASLANGTAYTLGIAPVEDAANNATTLQSATFTTIAAATPTITLTSTHTGPYYANDVVTVTWTSANIETVLVQAWVPSLGEWLTMATAAGSAGTATFTVPADAQYSTAYKLRVKPFDAETPVSETGTFKVRAVAQNLLTVRGYAVNDEFRYSGTAIVTFTRPAGAPGYNQKYIVDATAGMLIHDASTVITTPYAIGDGMSGLVARRGVFNQLVQIVPLTDPGAPVSTGNEIVPEVKTLSNITSADQGKLVLVNGVTFATSGTFAAGQNYTITDASKGSMFFRTQFAEADYIGQPIPTRPLDLVMLVGQFNTDLQLSARSMADMEQYPQLTVAAGQNGTVSNSSGYYTEGTEITVTATPAQGYLFVNWTDGNSNVVSTANPYTFNMPAADLTLTANFRAFVNGSINPTNVQYFLNWDNGIFTSTITWGDATAVTGLSYWEVEDEMWVPLPIAMWEVVNNNGVTATLNVDLNQAPGKMLKNSKGEYIYNSFPWRVEFNLGQPAQGTVQNMVKTFVRTFEVVNPASQPIVGATVVVQPYSGNGNPGLVWSVINPTTFELAARRDYFVTVSAPGYQTSSFSLENVENDGTMTVELTPSTPTTYTVTYLVVNGFGGNLSAYVNGTLISFGSVIDAGQNIVFEANPWWGYMVKEWKVNDVVVANYTDATYTYSNLDKNIFVTVEFEQFIFPNIQPEEQFFSLLDPADVEFEVVWGSESEITGINYSYWNEEDVQVIVPLVEGADYTVIGNTLTISQSFIEDNYQYIGDYMQFVAEFGMGSEAYFGVIVVSTVSPMLMPSEVAFDLTNPGDVFTNILYAEAEAITSVSVGGIELVEGEDYHIEGTFFFVHNSYLSSLLNEVDDVVVIDVEFDTEDVATLTITAIESGVMNATINPTAVTYNNIMPEYQDITITWNDATAVTGLNVKLNFGFGFEEFEWPYYVVTDNGNGTANLRISFAEVDKIASKETTYITYALVTISFDAGAPAFFFMTIMETYYDVIVNVNPEGAGWVWGANDYREGETVELGAGANFGYRFVNWTNEQGVVLSTESEYSFKMPAHDVVLNANFEMVKMVTFYVYNQSNSNFISDAVITINGVQYAPGFYNFELPVGSYSYFINRTGFITLTGTFEVVNENVFINAPMVPGTNPTFTVTFAIVDGESNPITDAVVTFNGVAGAAGNYAFTGVEPGIYSYSVAKGGFVTFAGSVTVTNSNVTVPVVLNLVSINSNTFANFSAYPNPFSSTINLSNPAVVSKVVVTNIIGQRVMDVATNGAGSIETAGLPAGIYLVTFEAASGERLVRKMIKK